MNRLFLIYDGAIAGTAEQEDGLPEGFKAIEGEDLPIDRLYFDGAAIKQKPPQPSPNHYWSNRDRSWLEPPPITFPPVRDWAAFRLGMLSNSDYNTMLDRAEAKGASRTVTRLETAVNMAEPHYETIMFLWGQVRAALLAVEYPTTTATQKWEAIAKKANLPLEFFGKGELKLRAN